MLKNQTIMLRRNLMTAFSTSLTGARWWGHVGLAPKDPIVGVTEAFLADPSPNKINLGAGAYGDDEGKPILLQCVREAEAKISGTHFMELSSSAISSRFVEESVKLVYGKDSDVIKEGRCAGIQAISGTGACRLFAELQKRFHPESRIYLPDPTWSNHPNIWRDVQVPTTTFHYYDRDTKGLNFAALLDDVENAPNGSVFLLHPCAHNPTGIDPTEEQWREISYLFKVKKHFPFFDMAYQGVASGDLERDANSIRVFLEDRHSVGCAQSFAKNMGLYGQRVGCLSVLCDDWRRADAIKSQLQQIANAMYGSPPTRGAILVSTILSDPEIKELWVREVEVMVNRIHGMRVSLLQALEKVESPWNWKHITNQVGMFCFSGLTPGQVDTLARDFHVYMTHDGRISMAGVTPSNVDYLANAIHEVTINGEESMIQEQ